MIETHACIDTIFQLPLLESHSSSLLACFPNPIFYILFMAILWCSSSSSPFPSKSNTTSQTHEENPFTENPFAALPKTCPTCGHQLDHCQEDTGGVGIQELPGLPAGVKFDPTDQELLEHLEGKVRFDIRSHPRIDEFIHTIEGENGICYTHPEKLPGVNKDGLIRHFFHRPAKAYPTGTRKRRKVHMDDEDGSETRWHKTGKTRPVILDGEVKGYKKILVLYINYRKLKKSEKTNWVMHQYHLGNNEEERDGELVVSKVFYQTQPRHTAPSSSSGVNKDSLLIPSNLEGGQGQGVTSPLPISVDWSSRDIVNPSHRALIMFRH